MTKTILYVRIYIMNIYLKRKTKFYLITVLFILLSLCFAFGFYKPILTKADSKAVSASPFLPQSDLESLSLSNTTAVYCDKSVTAIVENSYIFTLYNNGEKFIINDNIDTLNQILDVKLFNNSSLFFSANARLYCFDLQTRTYSKVQLGNSLDEPVSYFDFNQNYLVTTYQETCKIFQISNNTFTSVSSTGIKIADGSNATINENNELFLVGNSGVYKTLASLPAIQTIDNTLISVTPSTLIANNDHVYYILNNKIYGISLTDGKSTEFSTLPIDSNYQLGNIVAPKKISFINNNILVLQDNSVQEFKIEEDRLVFTGFAIAKHQTAYNRVLSNASKIEKTNDTIAVLDEFKLTVFTNAITDNRYARENYKNYLISSLTIDGISPSSFALGNKNALMFYNDNDVNKFISLLDFSKNENFLSDKIYLPTYTNLKDVCYQSGNYYILCDNGTSPQHVYKSSFIDGNLSFVKIDSNDSTTEFSMISVDVYGNIFLANNNSIAKLTKQDSYTQIQQVASFDNIQKLQTDLLGNLFVLSNGKIICVNNNAEYSIDNIKNFALDFVDNGVYYIKSDSEIIYSTSDLDNVSIADLIVPETYSLTNPDGVFKANDNLNFFTVPNGANAYVVKTQGDKFIFEQLTTYLGEYVKICSVDYMSTQKFYVLANQNDLVLVDVECAEAVQKQKITDIAKIVFVATDVHAYFFPIININADFAFNNIDKIRLQKTTQLNVSHKINFLDCDYYYAEFTFNDNVYSAYIPCSYTVEILNEDFKWDSYRIEIIKATSVFEKDDMQTKIISLKENTQVRLIEKGDSISKIAFKLDDGTYQIGFIYTNKIIDKANIAIRNILIILAVAACVCGTLTYFLLRKRKS